MGPDKLKSLTTLIRYFSIISSTAAGSGHLTSSLSAVELMTVLAFDGFFKYDLKNPQNPCSDRLIFSKGHASPLFYSVWAAAGAVSEEELKTFRKFTSPLEGHPSLRFPYTVFPTGSLGQGLSLGVGIALNGKYLDKLPYTTYVLLGDSEMAEGSNWEALQLAAHYKLNNLVAILDVNRLGQSTQTMYGYDLESYKDKFVAFGWEVITTDGHSIPQIQKAFQKAKSVKGKPVIIIAKTIKGKGISFLEDKEGWHGKALKPEEADKAILELGKIDKNIRGKIVTPKNVKIQIANVKTTSQNSKLEYQTGKNIATRKAYGSALTRLYPKYPAIVALDAETSNSTYSEDFAKVYPRRYFEMFIAEQNMVGLATGLSTRGKIPFVSTFAAFFSRAYDQIRMSQYGQANVKFIGSHAGVSIGEDGPSQMGLEDIAMFRSVLGSVVLYPSDAVSADKLIEEAVKHKGLVYIRTTRKETPILYENDEQFPIGGSKVLRQSSKDKVTVVAAGITLHEALKAYDKLKSEGILIRVIDLYSIKPIDIKTLKTALKETRGIITVEDHHLEGGLGEAAAAALSGEGRVYCLAVTKIPKSGKPEELLEYEEISAEAIVKKVKEIK